MAKPKNSKTAAPAKGNGSKTAAPAPAPAPAKAAAKETPAPKAAAPKAAAKPAKLDVNSPEVREQIARRAYEISMQRGFEPGHEMEDWLNAEREVLGQAR